MTDDADRYQYTFDRRTGEPLGIVDTAYRPAPLPAGTGYGGGMTVQMAPKALLLLCGFAAAAGLYLGVLLFGNRAPRPATVVYCPPATEQVALRPAECGPSASSQAVHR